MQTVVCTKSALPTASLPHKHQSQGDSFSLRIHRSEHYLVPSGTAHPAQKLWKCDISLHFPRHNRHQCLANLCVCPSLCVITQTHKIPHRSQIILSPSSSISDTQSGQQTPKSSTVPESQTYASWPLPIPALENPLKPQPNCVTVTTLPYGCSATQWPGELGTRSLSV